MDEPLKIGLIGHSHIVCLLDAIGEWRSQLGLISGKTKEGFSDAFSGWHISDTSANVARLNGRLIDRKIVDIVATVITESAKEYSLVSLSQAEPGRIDITMSRTLKNYCANLAECPTIVSSLFGSQLVNNMFFDNLPPYDFFDILDDSSLRENAQPIDSSYVRLVVDEYAKKILMPLLAIRHECPNSRLVHVLPPPPLRDPLSASRHEGFSKHFEAYGAIPASIRRKWYRVYCRAVTSTLANVGIDVIAPPPASCTHDGFILEEMSEGLTHANAKYGQLLLKQVIDHITA